MSPVPAVRRRRRLRRSRLRSPRKRSRPNGSSLVRRAQQYDNDAIHTIYETYYPKIYNYAFMQMGDVQAAEDLASDVMLKMIEKVHTFKFQGMPFGAWVFRIARNRAAASAAARSTSARRSPRRSPTRRCSPSARSSGARSRSRSST